MAGRIDLSSVNPDYESIRTFFMTELQKRQSWSDLTLSGVGTTLIDFISAMANASLTAIERSAQETSLDTARLNSSVLTISRMLGVHISRKIPARVQCTIFNAQSTGTTVQMPAYTSFSINGVRLFNREDIILSGGTPQTIWLYEGEVVVERINQASGAAFQRYELGAPDYVVSDLDLFAVVNGTKFNRVTDGLWHYGANDLVFYENTLPDGRVEAIFGDDTHGIAPKLNQQIDFYTVRTSGAAGNNADLQNKKLSVLSTAVTAAVEGTAITALYGGSDENDSEFYRIMAPFMNKSRDHATTRDTYMALTLNYPYDKVIDAIFLGQAETYPNDIRYMNVVTVTLLTAFADSTTYRAVSVTIANKGTNYHVGDIIMPSNEELTQSIGGTQFQISGVDSAGGITDLTILNEGSHQTIQVYARTTTKPITANTAPVIDYALIKFNGKTILNSLTIRSGGKGMKVGDVVTVDGDFTSTPAQLQVNTIGTDGAVTSFAILNNGDYNAIPPTNYPVKYETSGSTTRGTGARLNINFAEDDVTRWNDEQWNRYTQWLTPRGIPNLVYRRKDPQRLDLTIEVDLYCFKSVNLEAARSLGIEAIRETYKLKRGSLGAQYYFSDIVDSIKSTCNKINPVVDYLQIKTMYVPNGDPDPDLPRDIKLATNQFMYARDITVNVFVSTRNNIPAPDVEFS